MPLSIESVLSRGVEMIYPSREELKKRLLNQKPLTVYYGIDPTGPSLHLGHTIPLRTLAKLQQMGHHVVLLIGDFTAMIGDPTDKKATRRKLSREEVKNNCERYKEQASRFISFDGPNPAEMLFNSQWLDKMDVYALIQLASRFTVQQMLERDMFTKRIEETKPIYLHEFLYPLLQGYDSVALDTDMEIGGNDQTFNMLVGRTLMKELLHKEKFVLTIKLLVDAQGKKMGKTEGNNIALTDAPEDMFGKAMSWTDEMIVPALELCTDASDEEIAAIRRRIENGENPMTFKRELARRIVLLLVDENASQEAERRFDRIHKHHEAPDEMVEVMVSSSEMSLAQALVACGLVSSKTEARRQMMQGSVSVDGNVITDDQAIISIGHNGVIIQKGKRHFVRARFVS